MFIDCINHKNKLKKEQENITPENNPKIECELTGNEPENNQTKFNGEFTGSRKGEE